MTRTDAQKYFVKFGIYLDVNGLRKKCFKCHKDLSYGWRTTTTYLNGVPTTITEYGYKCSSAHFLTYEELVLKDAEFLASFLRDLKDGNVCDT